MWQKIKALKEQRGETIASMKAIIGKGETEKRELTADESSKFNELEARSEVQLAEIKRYESLDNAERASGSGDQLPGRHNVDSEGRDLSDDKSETRALRHNEKCADYLRSRGVILPETAGGIRFGQMCRAMILGPKTADEKRALSEGSDSAGGYSVTPFLFADVIDRLRPATVCVKAGARVVPLADTQKSSFVKVTADPATTWRAENAAVAVADPTFGKVEFVPKTLAVIVKASRELLEDSINVTDAIEMAFANAFAVELDRVALLGSSGAGEPVGVGNLAGITTVSMGTNGAAITGYANILDAAYNVESNNAPVTAAIANPRTMRALNGFTDTTGQPLRRPESLATVPFLSTTGLPITETQGTATNASRLFVGDFSRLWIGIRTDLRIEVLRETYAGNLQYGFLAHLRADVQASHENAFAQVKGIIPA